MKKITILCAAMLSFGAISQTLVGTTPTNKVAVVEEFTGVNCPNCPGGHTEAASLLTNNPGQVVVMGYHPSNSSFTTPGAGEIDLRRSYLDDFYSSSYIGSRYMPSALINRRQWGTEKITGVSSWNGHVQTIIAETSPVNVGVSSIHDATTNELTVTVEVYYTQDVTNPNSIYVHLTEDDLVAAQSGSGGGPSYVHKHIFREHLNTNTWGDPITGSTTTGTLITETFVFDMSTAIDPIDLSKAKVIAFVYDSSTEENYSGAESEVVTSQSSIDENSSFTSANLYPNPSNGSVLFSIDSKESQNINVRIVNTLGEVVSSFEQNINVGENVIPLNENNALKAGIYFVTASNGVSQKSLKLIIQ